jgi:tyrosyl-tRNA synthetase
MGTLNSNNGTDGRKMSKSYNNFIALTEPAVDMFGKLMKISDEIVTYFTVPNAMCQSTKLVRWNKQCQW